MIIKISQIIFITSFCISQFLSYADKISNINSGYNSSDTLLINKLLDKSFDYISSNSDSAYYLAKIAFKRATAIQYNKGIASAFMRLGAIMNNKGINDSALFYFRQALAIRKLVNDKEAIAASCISISYIFQNLDKKDSAFYYQFTALRLNQETGDSSRIAQSYNTLGNLYNNYNDYKNSLSAYKNALRIYENIHDTIDIAICYNGLGGYYYGLKNDTEALKYFLKSKILDEKLNNSELLSGTYNNIALCYKELHNNYEALVFYRKALSISEHNQETPKTAIDLTNIGLLYLDTHQTDSALFYLQKGVLLSQQVSDNGLLLMNYESLADAYAQKGDYKNAFDFHKKYSTLNDSILNDDKIRKIADMQAKYGANEQYQEIQLLNQQNRIEQTRRNILIGGSLILLLMFAGAIYIFMQRQRILKKNEQIAVQRIEKLLKEQEIKAYNAMIDGQEEERRRIASDLHDRLGSMLATVKMHFNVLEDDVEIMPEHSLDQYKRANNLLDEACGEVRKISHNLNSGMIMSIGLLPAMQELCGSIESTGKIKCKLLAYGLDERLDTLTEISIYRMVQELFSNILKHARAKNVIVQLNRIDDMLTVTIEDDGIGFENSDKLKGGGMGLKSILKRAEELQGSFTIDSSPGKGTIAILEIHLKSQEV